MKIISKKKIKKIKKSILKIFSTSFYAKKAYIDRDILRFYIIKIKIPNFIFQKYKKKYIKENSDKIKFLIQESPVYSIVIPVYNNIHLTLKCLKSLTKINLIEKCEIIIISDGSSDESDEILDKIPGIKYIKNEKNLGFIRSCNKASEFSRGEYIVFLNNDTVLDKDWLSELAKTFEGSSNIGLVGSKLVYPDKRLQEAGGIVWSNGSAWNWMRKKDPSHPSANFMRDVDYVTGASLMISRTLFEALGRFDSRYQHSYYEDTDLAMSVRKAGYRVVYQPTSQLIHYEGASSGRDPKKGAKRYQVINREIFVEKWKNELSLHHKYGKNPLKASDRQVRGNILIIDSVTPTPDRDSGSIDMYNLIKILIDLNFRVHFIPSDNFYNDKNYVKNLQRIGVNCIYYPYYSSVDQYLKKTGDIFEYVILCRKKYAKRAIDYVKKYCKNSILIFYTVDLHFLRDLRRYKIENNDLLYEKAKSSFYSEMKIIDSVDCTIVLSKKEKSILNVLRKKNVSTIPLIRKFDILEGVNFSDRNGVSFIGGYNHLPNVDAVNFMVHEIWPELRKLLDAKGLPPIVLNIYGADMPKEFMEFEADDIVVHGYIENAEDAFRNVRLSMAPLRYGAGLKGKLATSFGYGVPVLGSRIAYEGVDIKSRSVLCVNSMNATDYAMALVRVYYDVDALSRMSTELYEYAKNNYSYDTVKDQVEILFSDLKKRRNSVASEN
ncbi:glycosyltransferase [Sphingobium fluviale]|uniref:Glycosyltransferase n=1 Tax=Sphingobium fluviale TaxID=2506423 RepID=A0A4Q1KMD8_9SPHN|nr:glycosyltransferase [Sphingobium fluviale]RXR30947.1 glycosyltransferase [Sphingobium fluviale]